MVRQMVLSVQNTLERKRVWQDANDRYSECFWKDKMTACIWIDGHGVKIYCALSCVAIKIGRKMWVSREDKMG